MMMRTMERGFQWRHQLQAAVETARVPLEELTSRAAELTPLLQQWHRAGLTKDTSTCLRLTDEGRFWASNILQALQELIPMLNTPSLTTDNPVRSGL